ncbi:MAG: hypothetical protein K0S47_3126 [Herbinix sp.]|jgi:hypothetical protein|nr:hypothetical protein [Herbinix sp.]
MSPKFCNGTEIILYGIFDNDYAEDLCKGSKTLTIGTKLYEYPYTPVKMEYSNTIPFGKTVLVFRVDVKNCFDTLDLKFQEVLSNFFDELYNVRKKIDISQDFDKQVIDQFIEESKLNGTPVRSIREAVIDGNDVYYGSRYKNRSYITYTIVDHTCIKEIGIYKYIN